MSKRKPIILTPISDARMEIFNEYGISEENRVKFNVELCTASDDRLNQLAEIHNIPLSDNREEWGNRILVNNFRNQRIFFSSMDRILTISSKVQKFDKALSLGMDRNEAIQQHLS